MQIAFQVLTENYSMPEMKEETFAQLLLSILILPRPAQGRQIVSVTVLNEYSRIIEERFSFEFGKPYEMQNKVVIIFDACPQT